MDYTKDKSHEQPKVMMCDWHPPYIDNSQKSGTITEA